jgi:hypothetical protein
VPVTLFGQRVERLLGSVGGDHGVGVGEEALDEERAHSACGSGDDDNTVGPHSIPLLTAPTITFRCCSIQATPDTNVERFRSL